MVECIDCDKFVEFLPGLAFCTVNYEPDSEYCMNCYGSDDLKVISNPNEDRECRNFKQSTMKIINEVKSKKSQIRKKPIAVEKKTVLKSFS